MFPGGLMSEYFIREMTGTENSAETPKAIAELHQQLQLLHWLPGQEDAILPGKCTQKAPWSLCQHHRPAALTAGEFQSSLTLNLA